MPEQNFSINALTNFDNQYWRVDWFGYLSYQDKHGQRRSEPLVDVYLSKFLNKPNKRDINFKNNSEFNKPNKVQVPISYLRLLRLGDVWKSGKRLNVGRDPSMLASFKNVQIDNTVRTMVAAAKDESGNFILPFPHHPYHKFANKAYCEVIQLNKEVRIVVPHYVVLQAYFSKSQYVFQQLFKFGLDLSSIYEPQGSHIDSAGHGFIQLKKWTHDIAAPEVARIAFDDKANASVRGISQNLAIQYNNNDQIRPKTRLPFNGRTNLQVFGKWCPTSNGSKSFVVYDILSCTASYPFITLEYFRDNPGDKSKSGEDVDNKLREKNKSGQKPRPKATDIGIEITPDSEPTDRLDELEIEMNRTTEFEDLIGKPIEKKRQVEHQSLGNNIVNSRTEEVFVGNTGTGGFNDSIAPIDFKLDQTEYEGKFLFDHRICRLDLFMRVIEKLNSSKLVVNIKIEPLFQKQRGSLYSVFPTAVISDKGRKSTWQLINYFKGFTQTGSEQFRQRRAIVARISLASGKEILLIESERRVFPVNNKWVELDSTSIHLSIHELGYGLSNYQISGLLKSCVGNRGVWPNSKYLHSIATSMKHPANTLVNTQKYIDRQISILEKNSGVSFELY